MFRTVYLRVVCTWDVRTVWRVYSDTVQTLTPVINLILQDSCTWILACITFLWMKHLQTARHLEHITPGSGDTEDGIKRSHRNIQKQKVYRWRGQSTGKAHKSQGVTQATTWDTNSEINHFKIWSKQVFKIKQLDYTQNHDTALEDPHDIIRGLNPVHVTTCKETVHL